MKLQAKYVGPATLRVKNAGQWDLPRVRIHLYQELPGGIPGLSRWTVDFELPEDANWALSQSGGEIELPDGRKGWIAETGKGTGPAPIS